MFYWWQTIHKKIIKASTEVSFNDAIERFKEEIASLKEHIHIKRSLVNAQREMKASLTDNDLVVQADFAEAHKNDHKMQYKARISEVNHFHGVLLL